MKFHSLRRSLVLGIFASIAAALVGSCGGGGAAQSQQGGAIIAILPSTGTIYAGVPVTFTITGGRAPYTLGSSEPALLPVPVTVTGNTFTTVAANPGVIDVGLDPNAVPSRTVVITVRDSATPLLTTGTYSVAQNFLTGYGVNFTPIACTIAQTSTTPTTGLSVPAGCEIGVAFNATTNGNRFGDRPFKVEVIRGPVFFVDAVTGLTGVSINLRSDHNGRVNAIMRTVAGVPTQLAVIRVTDSGTGAFTDTVFTVSGGTPTNTLAAIPSAITFTGPDTLTCGSGVADVFIFDGNPPYSGASSHPSILVTPIDPNSQPGVFRITVGALGSSCLTTMPVVFTDRFGARVTVTITTVKGSNPPPVPPAPPVSTTPQTITLGCGQSGSVSVTGGAGGYSASSPTPGVTAAVVDNTLTITRAAAGSTGAATPTTTTNVFVTDGSTVGSVTVVVPTTCP